MKLHYDIYMRPAEGLLDMDEQETINILSGWDRLELLQAGAKFTTTPEGQEMGNGTNLFETVKINLEAATLRVDAAEYAYLRSVYHNKMADVLLYDTGNPNMVPQVSYMRMKIEKVAESGGALLIAVKGECKVSVAGEAIRLALLDVNWAEVELGIVEGHVYDKTGVPIEGATVNLLNEDGTTFADLTDKDGYYLIAAGAGDYTIEAMKIGAVFPFPAMVKLEGEVSLIVDITETE